MRRTRTSLAVFAGLIAAAATWATPASADAVDDSFLSALSSAGVNYGDATSTANLGQSVCTMLQQPGSTFASTASSMSGSSSMSPQMAQLFTSIAISMYCPEMVASIENGQLPSLSGIPSL